MISHAFFFCLVSRVCLRLEEDQFEVRRGSGSLIGLINKRTSTQTLSQCFEYQSTSRGNGSHFSLADQKISIMDRNLNMIINGQYANCGNGARSLYELASKVFKSRFFEAYEDSLYLLHPELLEERMRDIACVMLSII